MKTVYCCPEDEMTTIELRFKPTTFAKWMLKEEVQRLIAMEVENGGNPIQIAKGYSVYLPDYPANDEQLRDQIMETDDVYHLLSELENMPMIEADEEMIELYKEKNYLTLMEFLCHPEWD